MSVLETVIRHPSDWIDWIDRTGSVDPDFTPRVDQPLQVDLDNPPRDLRIVAKSGRVVLWRMLSSLNYSVAGMPEENLKIRPNDENYVLSGVVADPQGLFLPRRFIINNAGKAHGHSLNMYRSPLGTRFTSAGGVRGLVLFEDKKPAAWALVSMKVQPPLGSELTFAAQADVNGEFMLPLARLPALTKDSPFKEYPATLSVKAKPNLQAQTSIDPDTLTDVNIFPINTEGGSDPEITVSFKITPGQIVVLTSLNQNHLRLRI